MALQFQAFQECLYDMNDIILILQLDLFINWM